MQDNTAPQSEQEQWQLVANGDWLKGQRFVLAAHTVLGRDASCDITIPGTHLSRQHAEIAIQGDHLQLRDLGSSNGTLINGKQVSSGELRPGDRVQFDVLTFIVEGPSQAPNIDKEPDHNATVVRPLIKPVAAKNFASESTAGAQKQWKTKPTSPGNRVEPMPANSGAAHTLLTGLGILAVLAVIGAIGFLFTQL